MHNHPKKVRMSPQDKNKILRHLSDVSNCFKEHGVGVFNDGNNNFTFCSLSKHNYEPVRIPLVSTKSPSWKEYTLDEVAEIIGNEDPCFLWILLSQGVTTPCLDKLLCRGDALRKRLNTRIDHNSFANYLLRIKRASGMLSAHTMWVEMYSKPLVYFALDDRHLMSVLLKHGADPHTSSCYTESQLQKMIPEFYGQKPLKSIYLFREHYAQLSSQRQLRHNNPACAEQTYRKDKKLSTLRLPRLSLTTSKNTSFYINVYCHSGQSHRVEKTLSSDEAITVIDSQGIFTCVTIPDPLDPGCLISFYSQATSHPYTTVNYQDGYLTIIPPSTCTIPTQGLPLKNGADLPNPAQFSVSIPLSYECSGTITSLTTKTYSLKSHSDIALFLLYEPGAIKRLNLIQKTYNLDVEELLLKNGADIYHNSGQHDLNGGPAKLLFNNSKKSKRLMSKHLQSPNLRVRAHEFIKTLFLVKAHESARTLLLHVSSCFDFDLLCESYLPELCSTVFTDASDYTDFEPMRKKALSNAESVSVNDCTINSAKETVSASIFQKFLIQCPELISAIFSHSEKIEQFYETITTLTKNDLFLNHSNMGTRVVAWMRYCVNLFLAMWVS